MDELTHQEGDRHAGRKMAEARASHDRRARTLRRHVS
jgi:hypothetical protein